MCLNYSQEKQQDEIYMRQALTWAAWAGAQGEVPIGAVLVYQGQVWAGFNQSRSTADPTAHAEIVALRRLAASVGNFRLNGARLYVTLEPCPMCAGAILQARLAQVCYALADPKIGACGSVYRILPSPQVYPTIVSAGILAEESAWLLKTFFKKRRIGKSHCLENKQ
jgi:tRNA(adenine34) deaminase